MKKIYEEPTLDVIKFAMSETITSGGNWNPELSVGVDNWYDEE